MAVAGTECLWAQAIATTLITGPHGLWEFRMADVSRGPPGTPTRQPTAKTA